MPREPSLAIFTCEFCGRASQADARMANHLLPFKRRLPILANGRCRHCGGEYWSISVLFAEAGVDVAESVVGIGLAVTTGHGFVQQSTAVNRIDYPHVAATIVAQLNEEPRGRMMRVAQFATAMERDRLKQQGGRDCAQCGALFVPASKTPWSEKGYCCKMCLVEAEGASSAVTFSEVEQPEREALNRIKVQCVSGHIFEVPRSFSGLLRPCPECGEKTRVPNK